MIIAIVGPTGVGKTKLSIALAHYFNGEVINADSTQVYRNLNIATAKIKEEEKEEIFHHLFDICDLTDDYTIFNYQKDARKKIEEIKKRNHVPIFVGGSGLYIKACLYDYQLEEEEKKVDYPYDTETLYHKLLEVDPDIQIDSHNRRRLIRAYRYYEIHKKPFSKKRKDQLLYKDVYFIGLTLPKEILYPKIEKRVDQMMEEGMLEEAHSLFEQNIKTKAVLTPIGYKELFPYFEGKESLESCIGKIKQHSRNYAKRQNTWFKYQMDVTFFEVNCDCFSKTVEDVIRYIENK